MSVYLNIKNANFKTNSVDLLTVEEKIQVVADQVEALDLRRHVWLEYPGVVSFASNTLRTELVVPKASVIKASGIQTLSKVASIIQDGDDLLWLPRGCKSFTISTSSEQSATGCGFQVISADAKTLLYNGGWKNPGASYTYNVSQYSADSDLYIGLAFSSSVGGTGVTPDTYGFGFTVTY